MNIILDACAVIAYERGEAGAEIVERFLVEEDRCWIHAINLCEVYYDFLRAGGQAAAQVLADLRSFEVQIYDQVEAD
ncbi:PIN domain-containing protein [Leptolyngbya sp. PCC 6406]|uniref:PIN domain-containing protein n=1 Tax=Leptolyngbya sp. PCC 6406 TaxID=1173264 RepID=UPI0002ABD55C|nr:PIN domain-containing protein [Leptolyngbya sp. PCC 6406]